MTDALREIRDAGLCHGCGACAAVLPDRIAMEMTVEGFLRPNASANLSKDDENEIRSVCSGQSIKGIRQSEVAYNASWGPLISVETGYAVDTETRYRGSSGGVISAIATYLLENGIVDFVVHTAAHPLDAISNTSVASRNRAEVLEAAGSRYAPSAPLENLEQYLAKGKPFAFIGKPCDVAALRRIARHDRRIDDLIPVKLAFFCAGVPSRKGTMAILDRLGVSEAEVVRFDYRGRGWPGLTRAVRADGSEETMEYNSSWGSILNRHLQFRCKICPDGTGEFADIACADAWHTEDGYPDFTERDGRSLILARTTSGGRLLEAMESAGYLKKKPESPETIRLMQPFQYDRKRSVLVRLLAMRLKHKRVPEFTGLSLLKLSLRSRPLWLLRNLWGTYRRL